MNDSVRGVRRNTANFLFLTVSSFQDGIGQLFELLPFLRELSYAVDKWGLVSNLAIALLMISLKETKRQLRSVEESSVMQKKEKKRYPHGNDFDAGSILKISN